MNERVFIPPNTRIAITTPAAPMGELEELVVCTQYLCCLLASNVE